MTLKKRLLKAVSAGELGTRTSFGTIITVAEFKAYFSDIDKGYAETFLPAAVIEAGQYSVTPTRYVFRIRNGVYRIHPQALGNDVRNNGLNRRPMTVVPWHSKLRAD